ncbi:hypothetical protein D9M71_544250 [compost metagenome]
MVWLGSVESAQVTGQVFESQGGRISLADGWRTGTTEDKGGRWQVEEIGPAVAQILAQAPAAHRTALVRISPFSVITPVTAPLVMSRP